MIIGRRGFITGLAALVAAPALVRVESIMPISTRFTPVYVPITWLTEDMLVGAMADRDKLLKPHGWPRPLADNWVNLNDYDPGFVKQWAFKVDDGGEYWFS